MVTVYDLTLKTHFINISGSCDSVLGQPTSGEFQYRYEITGGGQSFELESQNYDSRFGVVHNRVAGQQINFEDQTYSWSRMSSPAEISIKLFGTEWDAAIRDSRMSNRARSGRLRGRRKPSETHEKQSTNDASMKPRPVMSKR